MSELREGRKVKKLVWENDTCISIEHEGITSMVITMELGASSMVPWVRVECSDGETWLHNCQHVESIQLDGD